jgi:5'-phosphate synthase pdxT subunit
MITIGVLALQGAFIEHQHMLEKLGATVVQVRLPQHLNGLDGLVIPGGESTTIGKLATEYKLIEPLREFAETKPTWGTCAGLIFLAKDIGIESQPILGVMDVQVDRNAFGRQVDSFEADIAMKGLSSAAPFHAIFIRAPIVRHASENVEVLAQIDNNTIVAVRQEHLLGTAFHPELTNDLRVHQYFYDMVAATDSTPN